MADTVSNELIFETLKSLRAEVNDLKAEIIGMQTSMREGFSSLKSHIIAHHSDQYGLEQRMLTLENWMLRVRRELEISDSDHAP